MKIKYLILFAIIFIITNLLYSDDNIKIEVMTDEATIDFVEEAFTADGGIRAKTDDIMIEAYKIKKVKDEKVLIAEDKIIFEQGENHVEADKLELRLDDKVAFLSDAVSYVKVSGEGVEAPNDKIYYGGERVEAHFPDSVFSRNSFFTSCSHAVDGIDKAHFYLKAKKISVYPDKKIVAYNTVLYIKKIPVLWLPFYVTSLRKGGAPLFPKIENKADEGFSVTYGIDYGKKSSKYLKGSAAFKYANKKGIVIDEWVDYYELADNNTGSLVLKDAFFFPKKTYQEGVARKDKLEWDFTHEHSYDGGTKGSLDWLFKDQSTNNLPDVKDGSINLEEDDITTKSLRTYQLKTDLKKMGPNENINVFTDILYVNDETLTKSLIKVANEDKTEKDKNETDSEIKTNVKINQDTSFYNTKLSYELFKDLDPGKTVGDTKSEEDAKELTFNLNKQKINFTHKYKTGDEWERIKTEDLFDEDPDDLTIIKYDGIKEVNYRINVGDYNLFGTKFKVGAEYNNNIDERTLKDKKVRQKKNDENEIDDNDEDIADADVDPNDIDTLDRTYFDDTYLLERKTEDINWKIKTGYSNLSLEYGQGDNSKIEKLRDIDGTEEFKFNGLEEIGKTIDEDSTYETYNISNSTLKLFFLGELTGLSYGLRHDKYIEEDELDTHNISGTYKKTLFNNIEKAVELKNIDLKLDNSFTYGTKFYKYDIANRKLIEQDLDSLRDQPEYSGMTDDEIIASEWDNLRKEYPGLSDKEIEEKENEKFEESRLYTSMTKTYKDTVLMYLGNTNTNYSFDLSKNYDAVKEEDYLKSQTLKNSFDFKVDNKQWLNFDITNTDEYYDDEDYKNIDKKDYDRYSLMLTQEDWKSNISYIYDNTDSWERKQITDDANEVFEYESKKSNTRNNNVKLKMGDWNFSYISNRSKSYIYTITPSAITTTVAAISNLLPLVETEDSNTYTRTYNTSFSHGKNIVRSLTLTYKDYNVYKYTDEVKKNIALEGLSRDTYTFNFSFTDNRDKFEAVKEEVKKEILSSDKLEISDLEEKRIQEILDADTKRDIGFDLMSLGEEEKEDNDYKTKKYVIGFNLNNSSDYTAEHGFSYKNYKESLRDASFDLQLTYYKLNFNYKYFYKRIYKSPLNEEENGTVETSERYHTSSGKIYFGKPDYRWNLGYEIKYNMHVDKEKIVDPDKELEEYEITIGKEFHCTQLDLKYRQNWKPTDNEYDTIWTFSFFIRAFGDGKSLDLFRDDEGKDKDEKGKVDVKFGI